jgi:hypothetical protein
MTTEVPSNLHSLYHRDYYHWLETTIRQLKNQAFDQVDWSNLVEELEDMGRSQKRAVYSNLKIVLLHLLKYKYQPEKRSNSWRSSIREHRQRLRRDFQESPSLKGYLQEIFAETYQDARALAADETGLDLTIFPQDSPFSPEEALNLDYLE